MPSSMSGSQQAVGLVAWILISFAAAAIGGIASANAGSFYLDLARPDWAPPASVFPPVWTILYLLQGIASWLVWRLGGFGAARTALTLFLVQLAVNALWSWLFFAWHLGAIAFFEILVLLVLIVGTIAAFWRIDRLAAVLLLPYLAWVTFASFLNYSIWQMNPTAL